MRKEHSASAQSNDGSALADELSSDLRELIRTCPDIPDQVREAEFSRIDERVIDEALLVFLTEHCPPAGNDDEQAAALRRRIEALAPYLGRSLVCVLIRMPGVSYTIEIDLTNEHVVHWEWHAG
jgi:hypothetical protein